MSEPVRVLVIDDEENHAEAMADGLRSEGYEVATATSGQAGLRLIQEQEFDLVLTDLVMNDVDGIEILRRTKQRLPEAEVIVVSGHGTVETAVRAMREGATDFLLKPVNLEGMRTFVRKALEHQALVRRTEQLERQLDERYGFENIIGESPAMVSVLKKVVQIASTTATVLITGESGTGKELIAQSIHNNSPRRNGPFVALSCAALPQGVLESELFGHERGAFTGAIARRKGKFEYAHTGTLFLDEVGDIPLPTQVTLLRVIETQEIVRVGSNTPMKVDVRLIAATNKNLKEMVQRGAFREDLYYRLRVVELHLPALRERREDIPLLVKAFVKEFSEKHGREIRLVTPRVHQLLQRYDWPGNVRELKNTLESMVVISTDDVIDVDDMPESLRERAQNAPASGLVPGISIREMEKELIRKTLESVKGNRTEAARILGIGERTLYRKLKQYQLR